ALKGVEADAVDPQAGGRMTWVGNAEAISENDSESKRRYLSYFPSSASFFQMHDFALYKIALKRARFIGGFGEIYWVANEAMLLKNSLAALEAGIIEHMNQDHADALLKYCRVLKGISPDRAVMAGIDDEGFDVLADGRKIRFHFDAPVTTAEEARAALVKLARLLEFGIWEFGIKEGKNPFMPKRKNFKRDIPHT